MEAKSKVLLQGWQANGAQLVVLGHIRLARTRVESEIDATSQGSPFQAFRIHDNFLAMSISREDTVREGNIVLRLIGLVTCNEGVVTVVNLIVAGVQIERMGAINIAGKGSKYQNSSKNEEKKMYRE